MNEIIHAGRKALSQIEEMLEEAMREYILQYSFQCTEQEKRIPAHLRDRIDNLISLCSQQSTESVIMRDVAGSKITVGKNDLEMYCAFIIRKTNEAHNIEEQILDEFWQDKQHFFLPRHHNQRKSPPRKKSFSWKGRNIRGTM